MDRGEGVALHVVRPGHAAPRGASTESDVHSPHASGRGLVPRRPDGMGASCSRRFAPSPSPPIDDGRHVRVARRERRGQAMVPVRGDEPRRPVPPYDWRHGPPADPGTRHRPRTSYMGAEAGRDRLLSPSTGAKAGRDRLLSPSTGPKAGPDRLFGPPTGAEAGPDRLFGPSTGAKAGRDRLFSPSTGAKAGPDRLFSPSTGAEAGRDRLFWPKSGV